MSDQSASANTSPEEAILLRPNVLLPENAVLSITSMTLTSNPETNVKEDEEPLFGTHIRETVEAFRRLLG